MRIAVFTLILVLLIPLATANHGGNAAFTSSSGVWYLQVTGPQAMSCSATLTPPTGSAISWASPSSGSGSTTNTFNLANKGVYANVAYTLGHNCVRSCPAGQYWDGTWGANSCKDACPTSSPYEAQGYPQFICAGSSGGNSYANTYACPSQGDRCYGCSQGTYFDQNNQCTRYYEGDGICSAGIGEPSSSVDCQDICQYVCTDSGATDDGGQCWPGTYSSNILVPCSVNPREWCPAEGWCGPDSCFYGSETSYYNPVESPACPQPGGGGSGGGGGSSCAGDGEYCGFGAECCTGSCVNEYCDSGWAVQ